MRVKRMDMRGIRAEGARAAWADEIEHAIDRVKRTRLDKWMRREWHKAAARDRWTARRKARWAERKGRRSRGAAVDSSRRSDLVAVTQSRVWVKGHVPKEFMDWVERYWNHNDETGAMLSGCCFEVWERRRWPPTCGRFACHIERKHDPVGYHGYQANRTPLSPLAEGLGNRLSLRLGKWVRREPQR